MRLDGKVAIISGAASGMGAATARRFAKEGAKVVIADVLEEEGRRVAAEITLASGTAEFMRLDVTNEGDWKQVVDVTVRKYDKANILVNNAGISGSATSDMLDTDTCSYIMKRSSKAVSKRLRAVPVTDVCMSVITKSELLYGVEVSPRRAQDGTALQAFLPHVAVLEFPDDAATHYAQIRADLKKRGQMIGANDLFIAAHARSLGLRLVTNNIAEFKRRLAHGPRLGAVVKSNAYGHGMIEVARIAASASADWLCVNNAAEGAALRAAGACQRWKDTCRWDCWDWPHRRAVCAG